MPERADRPLPDQPRERSIRPQGEGRRHDHRDVIGMRRRGCGHRLCVLECRRHPRLGQDVLAGLECRDGHRGVHIGPGRDEHGIDPVVGDQVLPAVERARDPFLRGRAARRLRRPIGDRGELHAVDRPEPRQVLGPGDRTSPDDPQPERVHPATGVGVTRTSENAPCADDSGRPRTRTQ